MSSPDEFLYPFGYAPTAVFRMEENTGIPTFVMVLTDVSQTL